MMTAPPRTTVPFERGSLLWRQDTRTFRDALYFYWPVADREIWIQSPPWNELRVFSCGWYVEAHRHFWERRGVNEGIYIYCTDGKGFYRCDGRQWTISPGELLYCPPLTHHSYGADLREPWTILWMHVSGPEVSFHSDLLGLTPSQPVGRVGIRPRAIAAFRTLFHFMKPPLTGARMAALSHSARLVLACLALENGEVVASEVIGAGIQRITDHMERHIAEAADLPAWLKLFGGSRSHFQRQFKRATGYAPNDYFLRLKIRKACGLLAASNLRIGEIAEQVGIADPYYFSRQFRRVTGASPRAYRAQIAQHETVRR
jgi:AraC-like DNA-binding protein